MSYLSPGLLEAYNSLTDRHLTGYFNNTRIRRHLRRAGLITRSGRIVPEKEYRQKLIHRTHQRHVRECLAQAIFHKVLDMERAHQTEIKKRLEEFARRERVYKIKVERSKRHDEDFVPMLSPRPPTGPRGRHTQHSGPEGELSESSESPGSSRPNTAPGKMQRQRPVRLKPIDRSDTVGSVKRTTPSSSRNQDSSNDTDPPHSLDRDTRHWTTRELQSTVSPYRLPVINNFVTPVPPMTKRRERGSRGPLNGTRGRRLRPTTAPSVPANMEDPILLRTSAQHSKVSITMIYFGRSVHLSSELADFGDEVKVFQQHCGGENLCLYKGRVREGETFQFVSKRHRGFPFSLTFFLNGLQVERLSSCCEFKHRKGSRLGGRHGHFGFFSVDGAQPCYRCIIAMGLDKKPTPPPKRMREDSGSSPAIEICPETSAPEPAQAQAQAETQEEEETTRSRRLRLEPEPPESTLPDSSRTEGETEPEQGAEEPMQDDQHKEEDGGGGGADDYEEDFEADDEGPIEDNGEETTRKSASPTNEGKNKDEIQDAPEGEAAEKTKCAAGEEAEDADKAGPKESRSRSVSSRGSSSRSGSDAEDSDGEAGETRARTRRTKAGEMAKSPEVPPEEEPENDPKETNPEAEPPAEASIPIEMKEEAEAEAEIMEVSSPPPEVAPPATAEAETEAEAKAGTEAETEAETGTEAGTEAEAGTETETETEAEAGTDAEAKVEPEAEASSKDEVAKEEASPPVDDRAEGEAGAEGEGGAEGQAGAEGGAEGQAGAEGEPVAEAREEAGAVAREEAGPPADAGTKADAQTEAASAETATEASDAGVLDSAGESQEKTEFEVSEAEVAALVESETATTDQAGGSAESEPERAKSVQEKLAEAILTETHSSPEPELSDTSTEEEEEEAAEKPQPDTKEEEEKAAEKPQPDTTVSGPVASVAFSVPQPEEEGLLKEAEEDTKETAAEEPEVQASEERVPSPENVDKQPTEGEEKGAGDEPAADDSSTVAAVETEPPAEPEIEKDTEAEEVEADETPCEAKKETEETVQKEDDGGDDADKTNDVTEEANTAANDGEVTEPEIKEELTEEIKDAKDSEAPEEEQKEKGDEENVDSGEKTTETVEEKKEETALREAKAAETSDEPPESVTTASELARIEETPGDDTQRQGSPDDQARGAESDAANVDDATTQGDSTANDAVESVKQEPDSSIAEMSENPLETTDTDECQENRDQQLTETKQADSGGETAVEDGNDPQTTDEKENAEEGRAGHSDEEQKAVSQDTAEAESVASAKEKNDVNECSEVKDDTVEIESKEAGEDEAMVMCVEPPAEDKVEEAAGEPAVAENDTSADGEVKDIDGDAKSCASDGEKEKSSEDENKTEDKVADGDERKSISDGEKDKVEQEGKGKEDDEKVEGNHDKTETAEPTDEKETDKEIVKKENEETVGDEVHKDDIGQSDEQGNERKVDNEQSGKDEETNDNEEGKKEETNENDEGDQAEGTAKDVDSKKADSVDEVRKDNEEGNVEDTPKDDTVTKVEEKEKSQSVSEEDVRKHEDGDGEAGKDNEEGNVEDTPKDDTVTKVEEKEKSQSVSEEDVRKHEDGDGEAGKDNEEGNVEDTPKDDTVTKVEEIEKSQSVSEEGVKKHEDEDGDKESSKVKGKDSDGDKASECGSNNTMIIKGEEGEENEPDTDRLDMEGEQKNDAESNVEETVVHGIAVSGDGKDSEHSNNIAESTEKVTEVKTQQANEVAEAEGEQASVVINDENGEKMTVCEARGATGTEAEAEGQEPLQSIVTEEQRSHSEKDEQEIEETKIEEITSTTENEVEDVNGDDNKSERKLSSDGSVQTQVKVEEEKVKDLSGTAGDDRVSVQSKTSKDEKNKQEESNQDTDIAHVDKQAEETHTEIETFHIVQEPENQDTLQNSEAVGDAPHSAASDVETKRQLSKDSNTADDTTTKDKGQADTRQKQDSSDREEHKGNLINGEKSAPESLTSPVPLDQEEAGDLVSRWVNKHQTSRYFQTFVEPLDDDMNESSSKGEVNMNVHSEKGEEGGQVTDLPESDTLDQMSEKKDDGHGSPSASTQHTDNKQETPVEEFVMETKEEKIESDRRSKHSNDESAVTSKDTSGESKDKEITNLKPRTKYDQIDTASTSTKDKENQPYEQGSQSDNAIDLTAVTKTKNDDYSKLDSESLKSESVSHAKTDTSVHSGRAEDTAERRQKLRFDDVVPQSVNKDRLSTFPAEDSRFFGPATYPRIATAHPEHSY